MSVLEKEVETSHGVKVVLPFEKSGEYFIENIEKPSGGKAFLFFKRAVDIVAAGAALIVLLPIMLVIGLCVTVTSKGGALYFQERLGLNSKPFKIVKFRTMRHDAEKYAVCWSEGFDDPRITKVGRFLRKTRLDELPQLWNILVGDMTIVGPRPERECFYKEFETYVHGFSERLKVRPGLTGLAQVSGGYDLKPEEKIVYDVEYIKNRSFLMDIKIIFKTVAVVFTHDGAK